MRPHRFRIRTLMIAVAVVALELVMAPLMVRGQAADDPVMHFAFALAWAIVYLICNIMIVAIIRDIRTNRPRK